MILAQDNDANIGVGPITWQLYDGEGGCSVQPSRDFGMYLQVKEILNEDWPDLDGSLKCCICNSC